MIRALLLPGAALVVAILGSAAPVSNIGIVPAQLVEKFDHTEHRELFVSCTTCHAGATEEGALLAPTAVSCAACHDGEAEEEVDWEPRVGSPVTLLAFDHLEHLRDTVLTCQGCHAELGAEWMDVRSSVATQCLDCHTPGRSGEHVDLPDSTCASCHVPLTEAAGFTQERVAEFQTPSSHLVQLYQAADAHGLQAAPRPGSEAGVAASCSTCHVRKTCLACHVNGPEVPEIQALGTRGPAMPISAVLMEPEGHEDSDFEVTHGIDSRQAPASCQTCHTQQSCMACHTEAPPRGASALHSAGPGRAVGAVPVAAVPSSHGAGWDDDHGLPAQAAAATCASCHARQECLTCHVPDPSKAGSYHPLSYMVRHPSEAYSRSTTCADCHNQGNFCQSCHESAGLVAGRSLLGEGGYHDGNRQFFVGHGQAARQSLESCVSCHVEKDCLTCHAALGGRGRGFSPHGPGFDAERMYRKNPTMCSACHGLTNPLGR